MDLENEGSRHVARRKVRGCRISWGRGATKLEWNIVVCSEEHKAARGSAAGRAQRAQPTRYHLALFPSMFCSFGQLKPWREEQSMSYSQHQWSSLVEEIVSERLKLSKIIWLDMVEA